MSKPFDIVLWGATGYTGQLVAEYLARHAGPGVRWAIAGRSRDKLEALRRSLAAVNPAAAELSILTGDSHDAASLQAIVAQARVVCTTVGPYARYGTPLVAACVAQGVDYCDITGETAWVRANIDAFHGQAEQTGARIVHFCGVDSIPSDLGTLMVQEYALAQYGRFCQTIKHYIIGFKGGASGGTVATMMDIADQAKADKKTRRVLADPYSLAPGYQHDWSEKDQRAPHYDPDIGRWTAPFVMASINTRVVRRSHALQDFRYGPDFRFSETLRLPDGWRGRLRATGVTLSLALLAGLVAFTPTRRLLQATVLPAPGEGPSAEARASGYFRTLLLGKIPAGAGGSEMWVKGTVAGSSSPGYSETAKMLGESALCLALDDLPRRGGILTPAVAMGLPLVERLRAAGMTFSAEPWS